MLYFLLAKTKYTAIVPSPHAGTLYKTLSVSVCGLFVIWLRHFQHPYNIRARLPSSKRGNNPQLRTSGLQILILVQNVHLKI